MLAAKKKSNDGVRLYTTKKRKSWRMKQRCEQHTTEWIKAILYTSWVMEQKKKKKNGAPAQHCPGQKK